jgi:hypothetical protein
MPYNYLPLCDTSSIISPAMASRYTCCCNAVLVDGAHAQSSIQDCCSPQIYSSQLGMLSDPPNHCNSCNNSGRTLWTHVHAAPPLMLCPPACCHSTHSSCCYFRLSPRCLHTYLPNSDTSSLR